MQGVGTHLMGRRTRTSRTSAMAMCGFLLVSITACASGASAIPGDPQEPGIVLGSGPVMNAPSTSPGNTSAISGTDDRPVIDPRADLDIDDQRGDGTRVIVESLSTSLQGVVLVILDQKGQVVAEVPVTPGVQPVSIAVEPPLTRSQELRGNLLAPDGGGILVDGDGEAVEEDFDYLIR
jgi:hypothetical protein